MHLIYLQVLADDSFGLDPAVRARVFSSALAGPALINALRVEPELGTPARGGVPATRAVPTADGFRLSGRKIFSTGSYGLRGCVVWAATTEDDPAGQRSGPFLVPADAPGITIVETWDHLGMRASASHDVVFEDDADPARPRGRAAPGRRVDPGLRPAHVMGWMIVLLLSVYDGVAQAARDWLVGYLTNARRPTSARRWPSLPRFQARSARSRHSCRQRGLLGSLAATSTPAARPAERAGARPGWRRPSSPATSIAVQRAVALIGNAGLTRHNPLQRHLRDVLCGRIHTPQDDAMLDAAGRAALERGELTVPVEFIGMIGTQRRLGDARSGAARRSTSATCATSPGRTRRRASTGC